MEISFGFGNNLAKTESITIRMIFISFVQESTDDFQWFKEQRQKQRDQAFMLVDKG